MKVVVTGGSGQLGSLVLERLVLHRKVKHVVSLDLVPPRVPSPKLDYRIADVRDPGLERHVEGADALVHLAFVVTGVRSPEAMRAINVDGSRRVLEAALQHGVRQVVHASSVAAYGVVEGHPDPIVEDTLRRRSDTLPYADHKHEVEGMIDEMERSRTGVAIARLRSGILLGRRMAHFPESLIRRRILPVVGEGRAPIVWDEDVADAFVLALDREARGAFNLVADVPLPPQELARLGGFRAVRVSLDGVRRVLDLAKLLGSDKADPAWLDAGRVDLRFSSERARRDLGWKPRYPTAADVATAFGKQACAGTDARLLLFMGLLGAFGRSAEASEDMPSEGKNVKMLIHLDVSGSRGGDFTLDLQNGRLSVRRGIPRPPQAVVFVDVETLLALLAGEENTSTASATGKLRVRGEPLAGLVVAGIIRGFRRAAEAGGARGRFARGMSRWFEGGGA